MEINSLSSGVSLGYLSHMATYNRQLTDVLEYQTRLAAFTVNDNFINEHNATGATWTAGHNQFSDWLPSEYRQMLGHVATDTENSEDDSEDNIVVFKETALTSSVSVNWVT